MTVPTPLVRRLQSANEQTSAVLTVMPDSLNPETAPWVVSLLADLAGSLAGLVHQLGVSTLWTETGQPNRPYRPSPELLDALRAAGSRLSAGRNELRNALDAAHRLKTVKRSRCT